ncbi:hypothetical protein [Pimelobacter simplex]|uniref:hypothetical protein n=1 Tax=Nocardioides simplex TaxID=2045 RepID=UPI0021502040|nr:hypothetical protein [Pimelobacter simplex]UUW89440.1 hypothetical protein M0M43_27480 [Pimelobacter simplex]UUW93269.1 hypothetical protein M0M48_16135 [Pimelobacter simplex]
MDQRISFLTLAVADLDATRRFYRGGLGWVPELDVPITTGPGVVPIAFAHNLP